MFCSTISFQHFQSKIPPSKSCAKLIFFKFRKFPWLYFVISMITMLFWWYVPLQNKLNAFSFSIWVMIFSNFPMIHVVEPLAISYTLIWWYEHLKISLFHEDCRKQKNQMKILSILWTLSYEHLRFPDYLNIYFHVFIAAYHLVIGISFIFDTQYAFGVSFQYLIFISSEGL